VKYLARRLEQAVRAARASERAPAEAPLGALLPLQVSGRGDGCGGRGGRPALAEEMEPHDVRGAERPQVARRALQRANVAPRQARNNLVHDVARKVVPRPWIGLEFLPPLVLLRHRLQPNNSSPEEFSLAPLHGCAIRFPPGAQLDSRMILAGALWWCQVYRLVVLLCPVSSCHFSGALRALVSLL
jgi:hypothetical protein